MQSRVTFIKLFTFFAILLSSSILFAQNPVRLMGTVVAKNTGQPVSGVTLTTKNRQLGSVTNTDGGFVLQLPANYGKSDSLYFTCIGFKPVTLSITTALVQKNLVISLDTLIDRLDVVIIKPLTLKQLLDSVTLHNHKQFISPVMAKGYYREFVYTNAKCTEYSDALCEYYLNYNVQPGGVLKIVASRCQKQDKIAGDKKNMEINMESQIDPNVGFKCAFFAEMVKDYLPINNLKYYSYDMAQADRSTNDIKVTIYPKPDQPDATYQLILNLGSDFTLRSYRLTIPDSSVKNMKERHILGIHGKTVECNINVNYVLTDNGLFPNYYSIVKSRKVWGKMLGVTTNQTTIYKSEFLASDINKLNGQKELPKQGLYKKGNICENGTLINNDLLKTHTIIIPTSKETSDIGSISDQ